MLEESTILAPERATGLVSHKGENGLQDPRIGAQLLDRKNLKNSPAGKRTCLLPFLSCNVDSVLSFEQNWNKKWLSQLSGYEERTEW